MFVPREIYIRLCECYFKNKELKQEHIQISVDNQYKQCVIYA